MKNLYIYIKRHARELFWLLAPSLGALVFNLLWRGVIVKLGPDAKLYLSIADNFLSTGHFIQTARAIENFVVPFGVPLILTLFRMARFSTEAIVVVQHFMFGTTCMLLYKTEHTLFGKGGLAPFFFCVAMLLARINPSNIFVEHYFLLLIAVLLYLSVQTEMPDKKRLTLMNAAGVYMVACRAVLAPIYIAVLVYSLVSLLRRRITSGRFAVFLLIPVILFGCNTLVNYRETGYPIVMDSYSGADFYVANNPNATTGYYDGSVFETIGDEYYELKNDPSLNQVEKNARFKEMGKKWISENPGTFLSNTFKKLNKEFVQIWYGVLVVSSAGAVYMFAAFSKWRKWIAVTFLLALIVSFITAMGLVLIRYTIVVWPLASVHLASLVYAGSEWIKKRFQKQKCRT